MAKPDSPATTRASARRLRFDITSLLGIPVSLGLILIGQMIEGGSIRSLVQPTAALIVLGGTLGAVFMSFSLRDVVRASSAVKTVFMWDGQTPAQTIEELMGYATIARKSGLLKLEDSLPDARDPFLRKALRLVVDGAKAGDLRGILETENMNREEYDEVPAKVFEAAAGYAPTVGILGAVLGLIHVMEHLSDPSKLGGGIAVAFVATVYGVASANLLFLPMATKIRMKARYMARRHELMTEGVLAIKEGLSPADVYDRLYSYATQSVPTFDEKRRAA